MTRKKEKKERGSFLVTTFVIIIVLSLLGWTFVYTTIALNTQTQQAFRSKQAYYAADAGIERATLGAWEKFKSLGIISNKMEQFTNFVNDYPPDAGAYIKKELSDLENSEYEVYMRLVTTNTSEVVVEFTSIGRVFINRDDNAYIQRRIVARVRYYLDCSEIFDFAYFGNNFAWHEGAIRNGGSMGTNGFLQVKGPFIAGGDRYEKCISYDLINKRDDGGLFARNFETTTYNDYTDLYPRTAEKRIIPFSYPMPSIASTSFYEKFALDEEERCLDDGGKYGIYVWVSEGTELYGQNGALERTIPGGGEYIKMCDSVYGDDLPGFENKTGYYVENGKWIKGEKESLVITSPDPEHPVKIYGTVVVKENVAIKGIIDGSGAIYTGNNVYVMGGITYHDPPAKAIGNTSTDILAGYRGFTGENDGDNSVDSKCPQTLMTAETKQQTWLTENKPGSADDEDAKDFLGLFSNASVCVGDMSKKSIQKDISDLINNDKKPGYFMTGSIKIKTDKGSPVSETVNWNESNEAALGEDKVPNTRKSKVKKAGKYEDTEYAFETNGLWDVSFYTSDNPPPTDPDDPDRYAINPSTGLRFEILTDSIPANGYSNWSENQKNAVIPGSGEDLDGDGIYDHALDVYDVLAFSKEDAHKLRNGTIEWETALAFSPSDWGGNVDFEGATMAYSNVINNYNPPAAPQNKVVYKMDAMSYTNHLWGGYLQGPVNGGILTRIEATTVEGVNNSPVNHDDRIAGEENPSVM